MFNLWNPYLDEEGTLHLDITAANIPQLGSLTADWIKSCLAALGVSGIAESWRLAPIRTQYYSDYLSEDDWRDRWQAGWHLEVRGKGPLAWANQYVDGPMVFDKLDESWDGDRRQDEECCDGVLAFASDDVKNLKELALRLMDSMEPSRRSSFVVHRHDARSPGEAAATKVVAIARLRVGDCRFPHDVPLLEAALREAIAHGASVDWQAASELGL